MSHSDRFRLRHPLLHLTSASASVRELLQSSRRIHRPIPPSPAGTLRSYEEGLTIRYAFSWRMPAASTPRTRKPCAFPQHHDPVRFPAVYVYPRSVHWARISRLRLVFYLLSSASVDAGCGTKAVLNVQSLPQPKAPAAASRSLMGGHYSSCSGDAGAALERSVQANGVGLTDPCRRPTNVFHRLLHRSYSHGYPQGVRDYSHAFRAHQRAAPGSLNTLVWPPTPRLHRATWIEHPATRSIDQEKASWTSSI